MNNLELIKTTVQSGKSEAVLALLRQFIDSRDRCSCRELITEIMIQQDLDDVYKPDGEQFLRDVLNGDGWTGYSHLSLAQIIQEFDNRELFTDYFYFDLDTDSANLLRARLLALAADTQLNEFNLFQTLSGNFLCQSVPDNWENLSQKEQTEFIEDNKWQPLEYLDADKIHSLIQDTTDSLKRLFKPSHSLNINLGQDYSISWCVEDVQEVARDKFSSTISRTDAQKVLAFMASTHNACIGICHLNHKLS